MIWVVIVCSLLMAVVVMLAAAAIMREVRTLTFQVRWLRRELTAGLGVDSNDREGYAVGGFLQDLADDVKDRRKRERDERYRREASF